MYIKNQVPFRPNKLRIVSLNLLTDSIFVILLLSLLHSLMECEKKRFLKYFGSCRNWLNFIVLLSKLNMLLHEQHYGKFED